MKKTEAATADMTSLLDQGKWWRAKATGPVKIKDMDIRHKANTLAWLLTHAHEIAGREYLSPLLAGAPDEVRAELDDMVTRPVEWMLSQPLVKALARHLAGSAGVLIDLAPGKLPTVNEAYETGVIAGIEAVRKYGQARTTGAARAVVHKCCDHAENELVLDNG